MLSANQITEFFKIQYLKKEVNDEVYLWLADKHQIFLQIHTTILVYAARHVQITQNNKFAISVHYLKDP